MTQTPPEPDTAQSPDTSGTSDQTEIVVAVDGVVIAGTSAVDDVLAQVRERGFITTGEIFAAFPDLEPDAAGLRDLWEMFESRGIKVLDEIAEELKLEDERRGVQRPTPPPPPTPAPAPRRAE